jgi:3-hydroxy-3-methylglutaryl CoA synthase
MNEHDVLLGEIKGQLGMVLKNQEAHGAKLEGLETRMRKEENKSAIAGAVAGLFMAVGVQLSGWWLRKP